jgi:hypothetical protein
MAGGNRFLKSVIYTLYYFLKPEVKFKKPQISCGTEYELRVKTKSRVFYSEINMLIYCFLI